MTNIQRIQVADVSYVNNTNGVISTALTYILTGDFSPDFPNSKKFNSFPSSAFHVLTRKKKIIFLESKFALDNSVE